MTYLFDDFKTIKIFPANTRVYRDGVFIPELSDEFLDKNLPLHIIHVGKITGNHNWFIDINEQKDVFLTAKIETFDDTKIKLEFNPNLENIRIEANLIIKNTGNLNLEIVGNNNKNYTKVFVKTKLFAGSGSKNTLIGIANIPTNVLGAESNIGFSALCDSKIASLKISPNQRISSVPVSAEHSASIYKPMAQQIEYLKTAGLSDKDAADLLNKVFMEEVAE